MKAISATLWRVGDAAPAGQVVKVCVQSLSGAMFSATCAAGFHGQGGD